MVTCLRCQILEAALASGNERPLYVEYVRQIEELQDARLVALLKACVDRDHERVVAALNRTIADRNAEIDRLRGVR